MTTDLTSRRLAKADEQRAIRERRLQATQSQRDVREGRRDEYGNKIVRKPKTPAAVAPPKRPRHTRATDPKPRVRPNTQAIVDAFRGGTPGRDIATQHGVSLSTVYAHLRRSGIQAPPRTVVPDGEVLLPLYEDGMSLQQLADRYNVAATAIYRRLLKAGVTMRPRGGEKRNP